MHNSDILLLDNHNHWELYPPEEALSIASIERLPSGIGLRFEFTSAAGFKLDHLDISGEGKAEVGKGGWEIARLWGRGISFYRSC